MSTDNFQPDSMQGTEDTSPTMYMNLQKVDGNKFSARDDTDKVLRFRLPKGMTELALYSAPDESRSLIMVANDGRKVLRQICLPAKTSVLDFAKILCEKQNDQTFTTTAEVGPTFQESSRTGTSTADIFTTTSTKNVSGTKTGHTTESEMLTSDNESKSTPNERDSFTTAETKPTDNLSQSAADTNLPLTYAVWAFNEEDDVYAVQILIKYNKEDIGSIVPMHYFKFFINERGNRVIQPGLMANELGVVGCEVKVLPHFCYAPHNLPTNVAACAASATFFANDDSSNSDVMSINSTEVSEADDKCKDTVFYMSEDEDMIEGQLYEESSRTSSTRSTASSTNPFTSSSDNDDSTTGDALSYQPYCIARYARPPTPPTQRDWWHAYATSSASSSSGDSSWNPGFDKNIGATACGTETLAEIPREVTFNSDLLETNSVSAPTLPDKSNLINISFENQSEGFTGKRKREDSDDEELEEPLRKRQKLGEAEKATAGVKIANLKQLNKCNANQIDLAVCYGPGVNTGPVIEAVAASVAADIVDFALENVGENGQFAAPVEDSPESGDNPETPGTAQDDSPNWGSRLRPSVRSRVSRRSRSTSDLAGAIENQATQTETTEEKSTDKGEPILKSILQSKRLVVGGG